MSLTRELETLFFILLASAIGLFAAFQMRHTSRPVEVHISSPLPNFIAQITPTPAISPMPKPTTVTWTSSDGNKKVTMIQTPHADTTKMYSFTVTDTTSQKNTELFSKTLSNTSTMSIPYNAFSPDNTYLYLSEIDGATTHYFVFKSSGEVFANGNSFLDVTSLFASYASDYTLSDVTGWADPALLVVNAKSQDGQVRSFWLDMTTHGFIPLATTFQ